MKDFNDITKLECIKRLVRCQANLNYKKPEVILKDIINRYGPDYEEKFMCVMLETIEEQNKVILLTRNMQ